IDLPLAPRLSFTQPRLDGDAGDFDVFFEQHREIGTASIYRLLLKSTKPGALPGALKISWQLPAINVKGIWTSGALYEKRLRADWELPDVESRISVNTPVISVFGHEDENIITIACSDVVNTVEVAAPVREEDNFIYCQLTFFTEEMPLTTDYKVQIRVDKRMLHFSESLAEVAEWWANFTHLKPALVPDTAKIPLYSTWYAYHQNFTTAQLIQECKQAKLLGYEGIIVDDGWQTLDGGRGYDYTGDWNPDRIADTRKFVETIQAMNMKCLFWYSVPFCGKKSQAYQQFKGKFLTENHPWAPVFDPRYPEVRTYLIQKYASALIDWNLDGFKLDFIDDFRTYPETELTLANGRDYASVDEGVYRLMSDVMLALRKIKPDILIEFRQKYIGPAMRKFGNMFRAFDCPNDSATNRMRTTDVKILCGETAVHSDMITWHESESVETAALQLTSVLFSVPQLSVRLEETSEEHQKMIAFYTKYWTKNKAILMNGDFVPYKPLANYPILSASDELKIIYGVYEEMVVELDSEFEVIELINGKMTEQVAFEFLEDYGKCKVKIYDCMGNVDWADKLKFKEGLHSLEVPPNGMIRIK
ncbi:MAG: glycoside hydrolase family 36 protein, partial [Bacteroidota bacterium]